MHPAGDIRKLAGLRGMLGSVALKHDVGVSCVPPSCLFLPCSQNTGAGTRRKTVLVCRRSRQYHQGSLIWCEQIRELHALPWQFFFRCTSLVENKRLSALFTASETYSAVCLSTAMYSSTAECLSRTLRQDHCYGRPRSLWIFSGFRQSVNGRCNAAARCSSHWDTSGSSWSSKCDSWCPRRFFVGKLGAYAASV